MKFFFYTVGLILFLIFSTTIYLSTIGIETSKFNNLIVNEVKKKEPKIDIKLDKIKIKFDIQKFQLYLSTLNPDVKYQKTIIPLKEVNIYSNIFTILLSKPEINKIVFNIGSFNLKNIQTIAVRIKPSNLKTYVLNNLYAGKIERLLVDLKLNNESKIVDYKVNGRVKKISIKLPGNHLIKNTSFNFISDKKLTLINSISANYKGILITNGSIDLKNKENIEIEGKFNSNFKFTEEETKKLFEEKTFNFLNKNKLKFEGNLLHNFNLKIDKNYKIIDYDYNSSGDITDAQIILKKGFKSQFIKKPIKKISFIKTKLKININKKKKNFLVLESFYKTGDSDYKQIKITNNLNKKKQNYLIDVNLTENIFLELINFKTNNKKKANIKSEFNIENNNINFKYIIFTEDKNAISVNGLKINSKSEIEKISNIDIKTFNKNKENNNFKINFKKKIFIVGEKYDSTYLLKVLSSDTKKNFLKNFSKDVNIKLKNLITKSLIPLDNFNLIGRIEKGKFIKASSKSEFSKNKYLDISLKEQLNKKKKLEVYSDLPQALLADYKFFDGLKGGKLLYNSIIDDEGSTSKIIVENFKLLKAPAFATLLTLADLGGIADILSGEGMSFEILEINLKEDKNTITVDEILALGSSVSLHMSGYIEKKSGLISLSGTLVPAKSLNSLISKIPIVGGILVGKKIGEGVFGVSFKMKGLPGNIKTFVNPVKTLTPRFITRILEKKKKKQ
jgi:hypothetical protein